MAVSLPDDLLLEILVRVKDEAALFRSATACKQWRRLITDRRFLQRRWPDYSPSSFIGFFTTGNRRQEEGSLPGPEPCFIPARPSALGPCRRSLGSFFTTPALAAGLFHGALPLVSRHGLVVVLLQARNAAGHPDKTIFQLGVCNLHAATWVVLPPLKVSPAFYDYEHGNGYAILTGIDCCSKDATVPLSNPLSFFKVVVIGYSSDDMKYNLHMFSSGKSSWDKRTNCFDGDAQSHDHGPLRDAVVRNGLTHWLFQNYGQGCLQVVNLNAHTGHISLTNLPFKQNYLDISPTCLTLGTNGVLSLLRMLKEGPQVEVWEKREDHGNMSGTSEWRCTRTIELKQQVKNNGIRELLVMREKRGRLLINDNYGQVYTADLETAKMEKLVDWPYRRFICHWDSMPLEIDWPTIFVSGLTRKS
ncbi:hypothetical protein D1007_29662 [Hordeum vulgare]|nr:hypothetical protein D1007_29662 [Hordeum vulgare]